ncbi:glycosyltransferase family 4 protein [Flavisolibacter ginsenosidimutans]|uniref:Glycosyltransferase family 4 protein n=1 Tax=Flavisolibacter ginsenosidimutans TaxID=661481 RepID=A0A5B8UEY9_9BACT|nr:glycosyltransferase family 4 protein [Flavisolibacter ginsenosidimutans]QEC55078.1 glycosyltransferase family 4 protein [Flavisolibacter ginsenosidimutans]
MKYRLLLFKRWIEDILMAPLILLGKVLAKRYPLKREYEIFFFFPFYHIGGAEKVHLNIAKAIGNKNCIIFFTRKSQNDLFYREFAASGCEMRDISKYTDNKWIYFVNIIFRGLIAAYINNQTKKPVVFNGQCNFGYKLSPWISKRIPQIELIHSLCSFSYIRIPFLPFISRTVMISTIRIQEHLDLYRSYGIPHRYDKKITFIMNGIELPLQRSESNSDKKEFTVLYVGRGTTEKRVHLIGEAASLLHETSPAIRFVFMGDVEAAMPERYRSHCVFLGNQSDAEEINRIYLGASALILVSDTEGFPMVVMEAMARGLAILSTAVGEVPLHIKDGVNGYLLNDFLNEKAVVTEAKNHILQLVENPQLLHSIAANNIDYAYHHFGMDRFAEEYSNLFSDVKKEYSIS